MNSQSHFSVKRHSYVLEGSRKYILEGQLSGIIYNSNYGFKMRLVRENSLKYQLFKKPIIKPRAKTYKHLELKKLHI